MKEELKEEKKMGMASGNAKNGGACAICKYWSAVNETNYDPRTSRYQYDNRKMGECAIRRSKITGNNCCSNFSKDFRFL